MNTTVNIGLLAEEDSFTQNLSQKMEDKGEKAEFFTLKEIEIETSSPYRVILDRMSYLDKFIRAYLKSQALSGTYIINNPFAESTDDKFFQYHLAKQLGVRIPKTILLPAAEPEYELGEIVREPNLSEVLKQIQLPAILKPFNGYGWRNVYKIESLEELEEIYQEKIDEIFLIQEYISYDHYVRAFVIGKKEILPVKYEPSSGGYIWHPKHLTKEEGNQIIQACLKLNSVLDYDFNTVEFAIKEGQAYAIDFRNTVPEILPEQIPAEYYQWILEKLSDFLIECVRNPRPVRYIWGETEHIVK
ncbi:MAG: hypothetical protein AB1393_01485 [Candidatus Edwardsbacteria bacterium]